MTAGFFSSKTGRVIPLRVLVPWRKMGGVVWRAGGLFLILSVSLPGAPLPVENTNAPRQQAPPSPPEPAAPTPGAAAQGQGGTGDLLTGDWGGFRTELEKEGVKLSPVYIGEVFGNPSGGRRQGVTYDGLLNVALDLDLGRMGGGDPDQTTMHVNALEIHGPGLSSRDVGDFSNTSNIAAYNTLRLQELWLQRWFWDKRLSLKVGNMAVDSEYFQSAAAALFLNGTFGAFDLIQNNVPNAPLYPLASPGVRVQFLPVPQFYVMTGVYGQDAGSNPAGDNRNGTHFALNGSSGLLVMSEAGYLLNQSPGEKGLPGTYRIGSFVHTDDSPVFDGSNGGTSYGVYGVIDQQIYARGDQAVSLFVRSGGAPANTNFIDYYVDGGFDFNGFVPGRKSDVFGVAVARAHVSPDFSAAQILAGRPGSTAETAIEATYKLQLAPWWSVQPDAQYIITPGGAAGVRNAVVLGLRTTVAF